MIRRRYEVRSRIVETGEDIPFDKWSFFFRRSAENHCYDMNSMRRRVGYEDFTYYVHDTKEDTA